MVEGSDAGLSAWLVIGTALQIGGLGVAAFGVVLTHERYSPDGKGILTALRRRWHRLASWFRYRILRRSQAVHLGTASSNISMLSSVSVGVSYGPLDPAFSKRKQIRLLDERIRGLRLALEAAEGRITAEAQRVDGLAAEVAQAEVNAKQHADSGLQEFATNGPALEAAGLAVTALGIGLALIP